MREIAAIISMTLAAACAVAQSPQPTFTAPAPPSPDTDLTIHYKGPGVTAPVLVALSDDFDELDHCKKVDGEEKLLIAVDRTGTAQTIMVRKTLGNGLDVMALRIVNLDRFMPGTVDGSPAIVAVTDTMKLETCRVERIVGKGQRQSVLHLRSMPDQAFDLVEPPNGAPTELPPKPGTTNGILPSQALSNARSEVTPPVLIHHVDPTFPRGRHENGTCMISIIVDVNGVPQHLRIVKSLNADADEAAFEAVKQFRFRPGLKNGVPVPLMITIEVNFQHY